MMNTQSGAASHAACLQLFRYHPLAATTTGAGDGPESMVLRHRTEGYFVLTKENEDLFVIRSWDPRDGVEERIRPRQDVPSLICNVVGHSLPIPRHGTLLGWITGKQVTAMLAVHAAPPAGVSDDDGPVPVPEMRVLPLTETVEQFHWPPFTVSPLNDWRLWEYVEWGEIVDVVPLARQYPGRMHWIPSPDGRRTGDVLVRDNLRAEKFWIPAGVYTDHWALREGLVPPPPSRLLELPGAADAAAGAVW